MSSGNPATNKVASAAVDTLMIAGNDRSTEPLMTATVTPIAAMPMIATD